MTRVEKTDVSAAQLMERLEESAHLMGVVQGEEGPLREGKNVEEGREKMEEEVSYAGSNQQNGGPILERLEDLLAETAMYAVGDDQKAEKWKAPSMSAAADARRRSLWRKGKETLRTPLRSMGEMGIGMELYFVVTRELAKLFTGLTALHFPVMLLNGRALKCAGDDSVSSCDYEANRVNFFAPKMSLGDGCPAGVDRIRLGGFWLLKDFKVDVKPSQVLIGHVLCGTQLATAVIGMVFAVWMHRRVMERLNEIQLQHARVSQFSVLVTNLPRDADEYELVRHFSRRYDLSRPQVSYPIYGLDVRGASVLSGALGGAVFLVMVLIVGFVLRGRPDAQFWTGYAPAATLASLVFAYLVAGLANRQRIGRPVSLLPLREEHARMRRRLSSSWSSRSRSRQGRSLDPYTSSSSSGGGSSSSSEDDDRERERPRKNVRGAAAVVTDDDDEEENTTRKNNCASLLACRLPKKKARSKSKKKQSSKKTKKRKASELWRMKTPNPGPVKNVEHLKALPTSAKKQAERYLGKWVADVSLIRSNGELIRQYMSLRQLWGRVQRARASVRRWSDRHGPAPNMHKCRAALNRLEVLVERMKDAQRELSRSVDRKGIDETTGAFVTFEHEWSAYRCAQDYAHSKSSLLRSYFQPVNLRLHRRKRLLSGHKLTTGVHSGRRGAVAAAAKGGGSSAGDAENDAELGGAFSAATISNATNAAVPIAVKAAPSPDDVLWENLGVPGHVKTLRRLTTLLLSVLLLTLTTTLAYFKIRAGRSVVRPTDHICREAVAAHRGRYDGNETCVLVSELYTRSNFSCPDPDENFLGYRGLDYRREFVHAEERIRPASPLYAADGSVLARAAFAAVSDRPSYLSDDANLTLCDSPCHRPSTGSTKCDALACGVPDWQSQGEVCSDRPNRRTRYKKRTLVDCYCDLKVRRRERRTFKFELKLLRFGWTKARPQKKGGAMRWQAVCRDFLRDRLTFKWVERSLILAIVVVNALLQFMFSFLTVFERHNSVSSSLVNTSVKTFCLLFLNTAVLVPLYNMQCSNDNIWRKLGLGWFCHHVLQGDFTGFSRQWYSTVGTTVVQTVALNMVANVGARLYMVCVQDPFFVWISKEHCVTQTQLDDLFRPRRFDIDHRYSLALTYVLCALTYCSGLPVLLLMAALYFWVSFYTDKYLVLRLYRQPPSYDAKLPLLTLKLVPVACVVHLFVSALVLSNKNLVKAGSFDSVPFFQWYVFACRQLFGKSGARALSRTCVAPLFLAGCAAVAYKTFGLVRRVCNPELVPVPFRSAFFSILGAVASFCRAVRRCLRAVFCTAPRRCCNVFVFLCCRLLCRCWNKKKKRHQKTSVGSDAQEHAAAGHGHDDDRRDDRGGERSSPSSSPGQTRRQQKKKDSRYGSPRQSLTTSLPLHRALFHWARGRRTTLEPTESRSGVPGGQVRKAATWRRKAKDLKHAHLTTRPGFTEHFRCLAPVDASALMDSILEKKVLSGAAEGICGRRPGPVSIAAIENSHLNRSVRNVLKQAFTLGLWRHRRSQHHPAKIAAEPDPSSPSSPSSPRSRAGGNTHHIGLSRRAAAMRLGRFFARHRTRKVGPREPSFFWRSGGDRTPGGRPTPVQIPLRASQLHPDHPSRQADGGDAVVPQQQHQGPKDRNGGGKKSPTSRRRVLSPRDNRDMDVSGRPMRRASFQNQQTTHVTGILFNPRRWDERHAVDALEAGWRKVARNTESATSCCAVDDSCLPRSFEGSSSSSLVQQAPRSKGIIELERVHVDGPRKGHVLRTWELIVAEKRIASYDIMANPHYRLALEFLESVGTFRPKRELVRDIGVFKEKLVRLNAQVRRQHVEKALTQKVQARRVEAVRRRERVRSCLDGLVLEVERRALKEASAKLVRQAAEKTTRAAEARRKAEINACLEAVVSEVVSRDRVRREAAKYAVDGAVAFLVSKVEVDVTAEAAEAKLIAIAVHASIESCVSRVESDALRAEVDRLRRDRDKVRRKLQRREKDREKTVALDASAAETKIQVLEKALEDSRTLAASYERVAKLAEHSARREFDFASTARERVEKGAEQKIADLESKLDAARNELAETKAQRDAALVTAETAEARVQRERRRLEEEAEEETLLQKKKATARLQEEADLQKRHATQLQRATVTMTTPRTAAAVASAAEAERVAVEALAERDAAKLERDASLERLRADVVAIELEAREAQRTAEAANAEAVEARRKTRIADAARREADKKAEAAALESERAREDRDGAVAVAREAERLAENAAIELEAARALKQAQAEALEATTELTEAERERSRRLEAAVRDATEKAAHFEADADKARCMLDTNTDAVAASDAVARAFKDDLDRCRAAAASSDALSAKIAAEAAELASKLRLNQQQDVTDLEEQVRAAQAALDAHAADVTEHKDARLKAETQAADLRSRFDLTKDAELKAARLQADDARRGMARALDDARRAETDRDRASEKAATLADTHAAHLDRTADLERSLHVAERALRAALTRLPKHDADLVAAQLTNGSNTPRDGEGPLFAARQPADRGPPILMHPSHLADALRSQHPGGRPRHHRPQRPASAGAAVRGGATVFMSTISPAVVPSSNKDDHYHHYGGGNLHYPPRASEESSQ